MRAIFYDNRWLTLAEAAAQYPVHSTAALRYRLGQGYSTHDALMTPVAPRRPHEHRTEQTRFARAIARYLEAHPEEARRYGEGP